MLPLAPGKAEPGFLAVALGVFLIHILDECFEVGLFFLNHFYTRYENPKDSTLDVQCSMFDVQFFCDPAI